MFWLKKVGDQFFSVSEKMKIFLEKNWKFQKITVLYDKINNKKFSKLNNIEKHDFYKEFNDFFINEKETIFTKLTKKSVILLENRPLLLLSNSSYSIDDDFDILLNFLQLYEESDNTKKIFLIMSGEGPYKEFWMSKFNLKKWEKIEVYFKWFSSKDYTKVCGAVDFGLSFHNSPSELDIPIKILDCFSC